MTSFVSCEQSYTDADSRSAQIYKYRAFQVPRLESARGQSPMLSVSISSVMLCVSVLSPALRGSGLLAAQRVDRSCPHSSERERSISASRCFHRLRSSHELISASFDYLVGEREQLRRYLKAGCARQSTVLEELTLPRKERAPNTLLPNYHLKAAGRSI